MLFPQQMVAAAVDSSLRSMRSEQLPPRLQPLMQGVQLIQEQPKKEEDYSEDEEILYLDEDEEDVPTMQPNIVIKTEEEEDFKLEDVVQQPQIQEYLRKIREQGEKKIR